ncbi:MAG: DUF2971 domain-containing protein [Betaproteobacteria bacterium]|nr:DUF2971 domain-containing protein [Betaproteobacteria bacterium]MCX7195061.1 DUF2971 domain-containing protein [Pseudomonadota bacterium]
MLESELAEPLLHAITDFDSWLTAEQDAEDVSTSITSTLYHYTDEGGLEGIMRSEELWLTSVQHLNDPTELRYGLGLAIEELDQVAKGQYETIQLMCRILRDVLINQVNLAFDFFVCCLSRDGDDLGQWRGYGDDGRGFSIGMNRRLFEVNRGDWPEAHRKPTVANVVYDREIARQRQKKIVTRAIETVRRCLDARQVTNFVEEKVFYKAMSVKLSRAIIFNAITCKHPAYKNEAETRLILPLDIRSANPMIETRVRGAVVVPYVRIKLPIRTNIDSVVVGPAALIETKTAVTRLLESLSVNPNGLVAGSDIPYRPRR